MNYKIIKQMYRLVVILFIVTSCTNPSVGDDNSALQLTLSSLTPTAGSIDGGTLITISGENIASDAGVFIGGIACKSITYVDNTTIRAQIPAGVAGKFDVEVQNSADNKSILSEGFEYVLSRTITCDAVNTDWISSYQIAENTIVSDWGATNQLSGLSVSFDTTNLYLSITGTGTGDVGANFILTFIDTDFGSSTGVNDLSEITDNDGELDNAISGTAIINVSDFGADFCIGTKDMSEHNYGDDMATSSAGLRGLFPLEDFSWYQCTVKSSINFIEMSIPLNTLYPSGIPDLGVSMAFTVVIANSDGSFYANQHLPEDGSLPLDAVSTLRIIQLP